ncbi:MAG TPA: DNA-formamidopyrimidine glycosylase family protein [Gemmataceae bacterium]|jgi:formamidopyrimidine-DNA glycosylase|nr:DNA-formamidopyrimidine glycosylase family protein [Gemmataceae bacterium]
MPELPDITVYIERLRPRIVEQVLEKAEIGSPFLLRTYDPPLSELVGRKIDDVLRLGKRIVWCFDDDLYLILHLMIAGRLHWKAAGPKMRSVKLGSKGSPLAAFYFPSGIITLTEAGTKKRASIHVVRGRQALQAHDPGGLEVLSCDLEAFTAALTQENHTLKRALSDPHLFSGIGNAYSDEILHAARLSPLALTQRLKSEEISRLLEAIKQTLTTWTERLRAEAGDDFPEGVTAFREGMAVHGRFRQPCPVCGSPVQRIIYAENETNYCPKCQTGGKILADRSLSRLLKDDWPRTLEELEEKRNR